MDHDKIRRVSIQVVHLIKAEGLTVEEGCTTLVFALATACKAAGGSPDQILDWVADQLIRLGAL